MTQYTFRRCVLPVGEVPRVQWCWPCFHDHPPKRSSRHSDDIDWLEYCPSHSEARFNYRHLMPSDNITPHVVTTPPSPTRITTSENSREAHEGITTNPSPHAEGNSQSLQAEKPVSQPGAGSAEADPSSEPSTHTVLIKIRDLLSTLAPKAQPSAPVDPAPEASPPSLPKFGDLADYWTHFDAVAKEESDNMIKGMKDGLDNLLIFVRSAFYTCDLDTYKHLSSTRRPCFLLSTLGSLPSPSRP